jgi:sec-independent protein translocase protein TatA
MFQSFGWPEGLIILTIVVLVFGVGKLPQVGGALGKGIREFRNAKVGLLDEDHAEEGSPARMSGTGKLTRGKTTAGDTR